MGRVKGVLQLRRSLVQCCWCRAQGSAFKAEEVHGSLTPLLLTVPRVGRIQV